MSKTNISPFFLHPRYIRFGLMMNDPMLPFSLEHDAGDLKTGFAWVLCVGKPINVRRDNLCSKSMGKVTRT